MSGEKKRFQIHEYCLITKPILPFEKSKWSFSSNKQMKTFHSYLSTYTLLPIASCLHDHTLPVYPYYLETSPLDVNTRSLSSVLMPSLLAHIPILLYQLPKTPSGHSWLGQRRWFSISFLSSILASQ